MSDKKRVLILTADAGFGHRSAANAISAALLERHGEQCQGEIVNPLDDDRLPNILRRQQADYDRIVTELPEVYQLGYQLGEIRVTSSIAERALIVVLYETLRDHVRRCQPHAIVNTYPLYQAPLGAVFATTKNYIPLLTIVTDLATVHRLWFHSAIDHCLVPTDAVRDLALKAGISPEKIVITGIPVHPRLAQETRPPAALRAELGWRQELTTVLAVGSRRVKHLDEVLDLLNHSGLPIQLAVVAGGDERLYSQFQATEWHLPTHVYNFVQDLPTLMHAADLIICKAGGLIVTESLACGLPLLLIAVLPGQEVGNAEYVVRGGAGELAQKPVDALQILFHWLDRGGQLLAQRAENARRLGRPNAAYDVAELAWQAAERGPQTRAARSILGRSGLIKFLNRHAVPWQEKRGLGRREL